MSLLSEEQFIQRLSFRLENFKKTDIQRYNCRCIICGDSKKDTNKARGWFFINDDKWRYKCFNCGEYMQLGWFIKLYDPLLYKEFVKSKFNKPSKPELKIVTKTPVFKTTTKLKNVESYKTNKILRQFIFDRKLPKSIWDKIFYVKEFKKWSNELVPNTFNNLDYDNHRILIPFYDENNKIIAFQGRAIEKSKVKYLTVKLSEQNHKIFGLDTVDKSKMVYVLEGALDASFIPNGISVNGADFDIMDKVGIKKYTIVLDNDFYNKEIVAKYKKYINKGYNIVIWNSYNKLSDVNDMILSGRTIDDILNEIKARTFSGMIAQLEFNKWKKVK